MNYSAVYDYIKEIVSEENILFDEPMSRHTTFRVGGPARCLVSVKTKEQLLKLIPYLQLTDQDYFVLGNGSNLLVGDKGYPGIIVKIGGMGTVSVEGDKIRTSAGALLSEVSAVARDNGLAGMEFASGIPGTVGGGIVMNAGAYDGEMRQIVDSVEVMNRNGEIMVLDNDTMEFGYRSSVMKDRSFIALEAVLQLQKGNPEEIAAKMKELSEKRKEKQPLEYPSAGSTFKRPDGYFAGKLIMDTGLRGFGIGGAKVSDKHCGFIVNAGNATAADIREVIEEVRRRVKERFGVSLEKEVIYLGEF